VLNLTILLLSTSFGKVKNQA